MRNCRSEVLPKEYGEMTRKEHFGDSLVIKGYQEVGKKAFTP